MTRLKPCKPGTERNPKTNRCRRLLTKKTKKHKKMNSSMVSSKVSNSHFTANKPKMTSLYGLYYYFDNDNGTRDSNLLAISYDDTHHPLHRELNKIMMQLLEDPQQTVFIHRSNFVHKPVNVYTFTKEGLQSVDLYCIADPHALTFYGVNMAIENIKTGVDGQPPITTIFDGVVFGDPDIIKHCQSLNNDNRNVRPWYSISSEPLKLDTLYEEGVVNA